MNAQLIAGVPKTIELGYKTFNVRIIEAHPGHPLAGSLDFHPGNLTIEHDKNYAPHELVNTVVHEALHAIWRLSDIGGDQQHEEYVVTVMANGLTDLMRRNPDLMGWIKEALESET